jgi:hypothetical protein
VLRLKKKPAFMALDGITVALAGLLFLEVHSATRPPDVRTQRSALSASQTQHLDDTNISAPEPTLSTWRNMMLSRPLFDPTRRPPAPTQAPAAPVELPRLSGIMVTPTEKIAVFSPATGAPIIVNQNSRFGPFTVMAISGETVAIKGPSGVIVLRSDFSAREGPVSSTAASTLLADGISLKLIKIALPDVTNWPAPPPAH